MALVNKRLGIVAKVAYIDTWLNYSIVFISII